MPHEIECRTVKGNVELRKKGDTGTAVLVGYAALFDTLSEDLGGFREQLKPGCFTRALDEKQDVLARAEHDSRLILGRSSDGSLRLTVDDRGLWYEVDCPDTQAGRDYAELCRRGTVKQSSFAFIVRDKADADWEVRDDGQVIRTILACDLVDVAPVAMPAYTETTVSARALEQARTVKPAAAAPPASDPKASVRAVIAKEAKAAGVSPEELKRQAFARAIGVWANSIAAPGAPDPMATRRNAALAGLQQRAASYEDQVAAIWSELYELLGYPWSEGGCNWCLVATYPDKAIVEMEPGQYVAFPVTFDKANSVTLGEPVAVEKTWTEIPGVVVGDEPGPGDDAEGEGDGGGGMDGEGEGDRAAAQIASLRRRNDFAGAA